MDEYLTTAVHEEFSKRLDAHNARQDKRIEILEDTVKELAAQSAAIKQLAVSVETLAKEIEKQGKRLESLEQKDGEMWRTVVKQAVVLVVAAVVGYALAHIGF